MGIGNVMSRLTALQVPGRDRFLSQSAGVTNDAAQSTLAIPKIQRQQQLRAGFGRDSISQPGMALRTVGSTIEGARNTVPSARQNIEDTIVAQARKRKEELQRTREQQTDPNLAFPEPSAQVNQFVNSANQAAATAQAHAEEKNSERPPRGASVEVNGQAHQIRAYRERAAQPAKPAVSVAA